MAGRGRAVKNRTEPHRLDQRPAYFSKNSVRNGPSPLICTMTCPSGAATTCGTPAGMTMKLALLAHRAMATRRDRALRKERGFCERHQQEGRQRHKCERLPCVLLMMPINRRRQSLPQGSPGSSAERDRRTRYLVARPHLRVGHVRGRKDAPSERGRRGRRAPPFGLPPPHVRLATGTSRGGPGPGALRSPRPGRSRHRSGVRRMDMTALREVSARRGVGSSGRIRTEERPST